MIISPPAITYRRPPSVPGESAAFAWSRHCLHLPENILDTRPTVSENKNRQQLILQAIGQSTCWQEYHRSARGLIFYYRVLYKGERYLQHTICKFQFIIVKIKGKKMP
jgi:hypothetical protein